MEVVRGYQFSDEKEPVNTDKLNALAAPSVRMPESFYDRLTAGVATKAALEALTATNMKEGEVVYMRGYGAEGDGGGGLFRLDKSGALGAGAANGVTIFAATGGSNWYWRRMWNTNDGVFPEWGGVKADADYDAGTGTDDTAAMQLVLDACTYGLGDIPKGTVVRLPNKTIRVTDTLFCGWPTTTGGYWSTNIVGTGSGQTPVDNTNWRSRIWGDFGNAKRNRPILSYCNQRASILRNFDVLGDMEHPVRDLFYDDKIGYDLSLVSTWQDATTNARTADQLRYIPHAGICFTGYGNAKVNGSYNYPTFTIPSYLTGTGKPLAGAVFSTSGLQCSQGIIDSVGVSYCNVGIVFAPNDNNNTDQYYLGDLRLYGCTYGISAGQPNMRQFEVNDTYIYQCYAGITDFVHGARNGQFLGGANLEIDYCFYAVLKERTGNIHCSLKNLLIENTISIGVFSSVDLSVRINSWDHYWNFDVPLLSAESVHFTSFHNQLGDHLGAVNPSEAARYYYPSPSIPWILAENVEIDRYYVFDVVGNVSNPYTVITPAWMADLENFAVDTVAKENLLIHAATRRIAPGFLVVPLTGKRAVAALKYGRIISTNNNLTIHNSRLNYTAGGAHGSGVMTQRGVVPFYTKGGLDTDSLAPINTIEYHNARVGVLNNQMTISEALGTTVVGSQTIKHREIYADIVTTVPNSITSTLKKGSLFAVRKTTGPQVFCVVRGPDDLDSVMNNGTAQAGAGTEITLEAGASAVDNFYTGHKVIILSGTGAGQERLITGYVGATKVATVATWGTNPDNTSVYKVRHMQTWKAKCILGFQGWSDFASDFPTGEYTGSGNIEPVAHLRPSRVLPMVGVELYGSFTSGSSTVNIMTSGGGGTNIDLTKLMLVGDNIALLENGYLVGNTTYDENRFPMKVASVVSASQFTMSQNARETGIAKFVIY